MVKLKGLIQQEQNFLLVYKVVTWHLAEDWVASGESFGATPVEFYY